MPSWPKILYMELSATVASARCEDQAVLRSHLRVEDGLHFDYVLRRACCLALRYESSELLLVIL